MESVQRRVIEAEEYRLVDSGGKLRALITTAATGDGEPAVILFDRQGLSRLVIDLQADAPRITIHAPSGQPVAGLGVHEDGGTALALSRESGTLGFYVRVPPNGDATVQKFDKDGQPMR